jgi:hypothetical protein
MLLGKSETALFSHLLESLLDCDRLKARTILDEAAKRLGPEKVFSDVIPSALNSLGVRWAKGELLLYPYITSPHLWILIQFAFMLCAYSPECNR